MAIRFQCAACSEPIEVDPEWARRLVRCPYCQRTVTAPAESVLPALDQIPMATASAPPRAPFPTDGLQPLQGNPAPPPLPQSNVSATVALVMAFLAVGFLLLAIWTVASHRLEMMEIQKLIEDARQQNQSPVSAMMTHLNKDGGALPGWMLMLIAFEFASLGAWLGSVIFGIIGAFRAPKRGMAVGALVTAGILGAFYCVSALAAGMG